MGSSPMDRTKRTLWVGCGTQMYFFFFFGSSECFLLSMMAYDRFVAICNPLRYPVIMNRSLCLWMAIGSWMSGVPVSMLQTAWMMALPFCGPNSVDHFFLWWSSCLKISHWRHNDIWDASSCIYSSLYHVPIFSHFSLLYPHYWDHFEDAICYWSPESIFYMFIPPYCGIPLLWDSQLDLSKAQI